MNTDLVLTDFADIGIAANFTARSRQQEVAAKFPRRAHFAGDTSGGDSSSQASWGYSSEICFVEIAPKNSLKKKEISLLWIKLRK